MTEESNNFSKQDLIAINSHKEYLSFGNESITEMDLCLLYWKLQPWIKELECKLKSCDNFFGVIKFNTAYDLPIN